MSGSQQGGSQAGGNKYSEDNLRPVTIKQLLDFQENFPGAEPAIDGQPLSQVTFVGQVRDVKQQATNITYTIDDGTAEIDVKKWIDSEADGNVVIAPDAFVRVWGRLKAVGSKKHLSAQFIRQIEDYNEVSYHMLEVVYVHLYFTKGKQGGGAGAGGAGGGGESMFVDQGYGANDVAMGNTADGNSTLQAKLAMCSKNARTVGNFINTTPGGDEDGVNLHVIAKGTGLSHRDVLNASQELLDQGIIYTTSDEETWAVLLY
ncbi:hypothetical protein B0T20DRAFT_407846 [Sordaria brevicollis]|uniref:Replication factor A protein 2 n=1 Tax=Sordaria brevicollis TaxID=83679 RepID=A0AAE0UDT2_SORBR|nr:hypothetical protein B0T20DRAFT_407846 [Sordaria brevicollis]